MSQTKFADVNLSDVLNRLSDKIKRDINCFKVGTIEEFDAEKQLASVAISYSRIESIDAQGIKTVKKYPLLIEVPVVVIGGGNSYLQMPINVGDSCLLLFSDDDLDQWQVNNADVPDTTRRHNLNDAVALVGVNNETEIRTAFDNDGIKLFFSEDVYLRLNADGAELIGDMNFTGGLNITGDTEIDGSLTVSGDAEISGDTTLNGAVKPDGQEGVSQTLIIKDTAAGALVSTATITITKGIITNVLQVP